MYTQSFLYFICNFPTEVVILWLILCGALVLKGLQTQVVKGLMLCGADM